MSHHRSRPRPGFHPSLSPRFRPSGRRPPPRRPRSRKLPGPGPIVAELVSPPARADATTPRKPIDAAVSKQFPRELTWSRTTINHMILDKVPSNWLYHRQGTVGGPPSFIRKENRLDREGKRSSSTRWGAAGFSNRRRAKKGALAPGQFGPGPGGFSPADYFSIPEEEIKASRIGTYRRGWEGHACQAQNSQNSLRPALASEPKLVAPSKSFGG